MLQLLPTSATPLLAVGLAQIRQDYHRHSSLDISFSVLYDVPGSYYNFYAVLCGWILRL